MEEARIPEFIINNGEQTYPETVESQKIETREEENVSCCSLDHFRKKTLEKGTSIKLHLLNQSEIYKSECFNIDTNILDGKCIFNTDENTNETTQFLMNKENKILVTICFTFE